jgi:hypothetical protein
MVTGPNDGQAAPTPKQWVARVIHECRACGWETDPMGQAPARCPKCGYPAFERYAISQPTVVSCAKKSDGSVEGGKEG